VKSIPRLEAFPMIKGRRIPLETRLVEALRML
jgi:hypothetical protein